MFHHRSTEFDPSISAIASHLRAIEKEVGGIAKSASRRASAGASAAGSQIADAIGPVLNEMVDRFGRGQRVAVTKRRVSATGQSTSVPGLAPTL